jgi:hypothetical protein
VTVGEKAPRNTIDPSADEVFAAVESLYADELKPFGRILRKRVAENAVAAEFGILVLEGEDLPDVDIDHLKSICSANARMQMNSEPGGDWSALIVGRPSSFVDIYSSSDDYMVEMWEAASTYFQKEDVRLPGGRYACAQRLHERDLPFFYGFSLGKISHVVQLAMSQKKILGYADGSIVPYVKSQSALKDRCAKSSKPCTTDSINPSFPIASWETARESLQDILRTSPQHDAQGLRTVPLSNVKRLFKSKYNLELSETMLGHSKLTELLQDDRFSDICTVQLQKHGYIVVEAQQKEIETNDLLGEELKKLLNIGEEPHRVELSGNMCPSPPGGWLSSIQRTFIHASLPPPTPPPCARPRSHSLPKNSGSDRQKWLLMTPTKLCQVADHVDSNESTADSDEGSNMGSSTGQASDEPGPLKVDTDRFTLGDANDWFAGETPDFADDLAPHRRFQFCLDEPLALEEASCQAFSSIVAPSIASLQASYIDDCGPTPSVYDGYHGNHFLAKECGPTPSLYGGSNSKGVTPDLESLPVHVTPSPSPTHCGKYFRSAFEPLTSLLHLQASLVTQCPSSDSSSPPYLDTTALQLLDLQAYLPTQIEDCSATMPLELDSTFLRVASLPTSFPFPDRSSAMMSADLDSKGDSPPVASADFNCQVISLASLLQ